MQAKTDLLELGMRIGTAEFCALVDSGATHCFASRAAVRATGAVLEECEPMEVRLAMGIRVLSS